MVKHNNVVPNAHYHKYWQKHVKTWFDQPGKKVHRRSARTIKAKKLAPRPLNQLHPIVRGQTVKYNAKVRAGRGFTLDELKAAGVKRKEAKGVGISVDHRRKNRSVESFKANVDRLQVYLSKLVVFPKKKSKKYAAKQKDGKKQDETKQAFSQNTSKDVIPIRDKKPKIKARKATKEERDALVTRVLRKAWADQKLAGKREKRAKDKAAGLGGKKKEAAEEAVEPEAGGDEE